MALGSTSSEGGREAEAVVRAAAAMTLLVVPQRSYLSPNMQEAEHTAHVHVPALNFWFGAGDIFVHTYMV